MCKWSYVFINTLLHNKSWYSIISCAELFNVDITVITSAAVISCIHILFRLVCTYCNGLVSQSIYLDNILPTSTKYSLKLLDIV